MAVYTKVSESDAAQFLRSYDIGELRELVGIEQGVQNTTYLLYTTQGRYILTLYEPRNMQEADLPFFLGLIEHLANKGVPCPMPVRSREQNVLGRLMGCPAAIIHFLTGKVAEKITNGHCLTVGRALATLHLSGDDFALRRPNPLSLQGWDKLFEDCKACASEVLPGLAALLEKELDYLHTNWPQDLPAGVIHADLFPDNVFFDGETSCQIFDFYFACNDFLAYDLAICINAWCFEDEAGFNITKARKLIQGYREVRELSPEEMQALPLLARGAAMRFLLTRLYGKLYQVPGALVKVKDPLEYLTCLQFHQIVTNIADYGLLP